MYQNAAELAKSTYTWNDPQHRVLKLDHFDGSSTTTSYVPAITGVAAYTTYLEWVAKGNKAKPHMPASTLAQAKADRIARLKDEVTGHIHENFEYDILRQQFNLGFAMSGESHQQIERIFVLAESLITAINAGNSIDSVRGSSIDFTNLTHTTVS